jgi:hypothetical protein
VLSAPICDVGAVLTVVGRPCCCQSGADEGAGDADALLSPIYMVVTHHSHVGGCLKSWLRSGPAAFLQELMKEQEMPH